MSDTYNYNAGSPFGMGGLFGGFGGNGGFGCNNIGDLIGLAFVAGIFGFGNFGGGWGGGRFGGGQLGADAVAATTAALISQQNTADRVAAIGADVRQVLGQTGGLIEAVNTVGNRAQDGFANLNTSLCQMGHAQSMQSMNNYNGLTNQITEMRFSNQQCCCDTKQLIQSSFCDLRHQMQMDKCATDALIAADGEKTRSLIRDIDTAKLREELAAAKAQISQDAQTNKILANLPRGYGYGNCGCNSCDPCCQPNACSILAKELIESSVNRIVNPTTTATAA